jgi:hypothetical protein
VLCVAEPENQLHPNLFSELATDVSGKYMASEGKQDFKKNPEMQLRALLRRPNPNSREITSLPENLPAILSIPPKISPFH